MKNQIQRQRIDVAVEMIGGPDLLVLDCGAGDGAISEMIKMKGNEVISVDFGEVIKTSKGKGLDAFAAEATRLPFRDEVFDAGFFGEIIEHQIEYRPFLLEAKRILKPNGRVVLTTPNVGRLRNRLSGILGDTTPWHEWDKPIHHVRYWTFFSLSQALAKEGFLVGRVGTGMSQGEGCILEEPQTIFDYMRGQWSMEMVESFRDMVYLSFGVSKEERDTEKGMQAALMTRSFVIMEGIKQ